MFFTLQKNKILAPLFCEVFKKVGIEIESEEKLDYKNSHINRSIQKDFEDVLMIAGDMMP